MPVPPEARPFSHALDRAERDGLRGQEAYLRALELLIVEQGDAAAKSLLAATRDALAGCVEGLGVSEVELLLGREQAERLAALSQAERLRRIKASRSLRGSALAEALLERARAALPSDPKVSGEWAECALRVALYSDTDDPRVALQLSAGEARAWAFWGNSHRIQCNLRRAEQLLDKAWRTIEFRGIGDLATRAEIASFHGSLLRAQRKFDEAIEVLEVAKAGWSLLGDRMQEALILLKLTFVHGVAGNHSAALQAITAGRSLLSDKAETSLVARFSYNEALCREELGETTAARELALEARRLAIEAEDSFTLNRLPWLEGRLCRSEGRTGEAIRHFRAVQAGFLTDRNPYDAALVSLELATLYLKAGRHKEVAALASAMVAAFESLGVHREALAAWRLFADAAGRQAASVTFAKNLARYLDQARHDPDFGFAASGVWE